MSVSVMAPLRRDLGISDAKGVGYYPAAVEFGTKTMEAQPYLRASWDSEGDAKIYRRLREAFLNSAEKIWLRKLRKIELKKIRGQKRRAKRIKKLKSIVGKKKR